MHAHKAYELDATLHPAEEHLKAAFVQAGVAENIIDSARRLGIPWSKIIQLMIQFGPQFVAMLQELIAALNTTPPAAAPVPAESVTAEHKKGHK